MITLYQRISSEIPLTSTFILGYFKDNRLIDRYFYTIFNSYEDMLCSYNNA